MRRSTVIRPRALVDTISCTDEHTKDIYTSLSVLNRQ